MILSGRISKTLQELKIGFRNDSYLIINSVFAGVVVLVFAYSGFFSPDKDNYPVVCIHQMITGKPCFSCGLSHSFSLVLRGRLAEAYTWNRYGVQVFIFFAAQLLMRVVFSVLYIKYPETNKQLIVFDIAGTGVVFLIAFRPFLESIFRGIC